MDTEKNRIKMSKYRARVALREARYPEDQITALIHATDWAITTPAQLLASVAPGDMSTVVPSSPRKERGRGSARPATTDTRQAPETRGSAHPGAGQATENSPVDIDVNWEELAASVAVFIKAFPRVSLLLGAGTLLTLGYAHYHNHKAA